ncbi:MAG: hypothetical protein NVV82_17460 [Sporocytophaga sp.]|nr:hypothetical protein [Sporocytophaga sp.]
MDIYFNNRKIELEKLNLFTPSDDYESTSIAFLKDWLNHKEIFYLQTSGSTSNPKVIEISREQMEASAKATIKALHLQSGDRALICINTNMIGGKMMLVRSLIRNLNAYILPLFQILLFQFPRNLNLILQP